MRPRLLLAASLLAGCSSDGSRVGPADAAASEAGIDAGIDAGGPVIRQVTVTPSTSCTLAAMLTFVTDRPSVARVHIQNALAAANTVDSPPEAAPATSHAVPLLGMRAQSTMQITILATDGEGRTGSATTTFATGALPADLPPIQVLANDPSRTSPGYLILDLVEYTGAKVATPSGSHGSYLVALDPDLQVVWYYPGLTQDAHKLPGGDIVTLGEQTLTSTSWERITMMGETTVHPAAALGVDDLAHAITPEPSGALLATSTVLRTIGGYPAPDGGTKSYPVVGSELVEIGLDGGARTFANAFDLFDPHDEGDPVRFFFDGWTNGFYPDAGATVDWIHTNAVGLDPTDGNVVAASHTQSWIYKVRPDGSLVWRLGPGGDFTLTNPGDTFAYESHGAYVTDGGTVMCFDNGTGRPTDGGQSLRSRAVEFSLDVGQKLATIVWQYSDAFFSPIYGNAVLLPGPSGGQATVLIDDAGEVTIAGDSEFDPQNLKWVRVVEVTHATPAEKLMEVEVRVPLGGWPFDPTFSGFTVYRAYKWPSLY